MGADNSRLGLSWIIHMYLHKSNSFMQHLIACRCTACIINVRKIVIKLTKSTVQLYDVLSNSRPSNIAHRLFQSSSNHLLWSILLDRTQRVVNRPNIVCFAAQLLMRHLQVWEQKNNDHNAVSCGMKPLRISLPRMLFTRLYPT